MWTKEDLWGQNAKCRFGRSGSTFATFHFNVIGAIECKVQQKGTYILAQCSKNNNIGKEVLRRRGQI